MPDGGGREALKNSDDRSGTPESGSEPGPEPAESEPEPEPEEPGPEREQMGAWRRRRVKVGCTEGAARKHAITTNS